MEDSHRCCLFNKYGNWVFRSQDAFYNFQESCPHPAKSWVFSQYHDYYACERCWKVENERMHEAHPDISRWVDEGGRAAEEVE